jgi:hypothetical protein
VGENNKIDLAEIRWSGMDWIHLAQYRGQWRALVNTIMNLRVPQNVGKFLSGLATGGFPRRTQLRGMSELVNCISEDHPVASPPCCEQALRICLFSLSMNTVFR